MVFDIARQRICTLLVALMYSPAPATREVPSCRTCALLLVGLLAMAALAQHLVWRIFSFWLIPLLLWIADCSC